MKIARRQFLAGLSGVLGAAALSATPSAKKKVEFGVCRFQPHSQKLFNTDLIISSRLLLILQR